MDAIDTHLLRITFLAFSTTFFLRWHRCNVRPRLGPDPNAILFVIRKGVHKPADALAADQRDDRETHGVTMTPHQLGGILRQASIWTPRGRFVRA